MILFEITGTEADPVYQDLEIANGNRQYDFLRSVVDASLRTGRPFLSQTILKAFRKLAKTMLAFDEKKIAAILKNKTFIEVVRP